MRAQDRPDRISEDEPLPLTDVLEGMPDGALLADRRDRVIGVNRAFRELLGLPDLPVRPAEPVAAFIDRLVQAGAPALAAVIGASAPVEIETRSGRMLQARFSPLPRGGYLINLRDSEQWLFNLIAEIPGVAFRRTPNPDGRPGYAYMGPGIKELLGVAAEDFLAGKVELGDLVHPDIRPQAHTMIADARQNLEPIDTDTAFVTPSGDKRWVRVISRDWRSETGEVARDGLLLDITRRRDMHGELKQTSALLDAVLGNVPLPISVRHVPTGIYVLFNRAAEDLLEVPREKALSQTAHQLFAAEDAERRTMQDRLVAETRQPLDLPVVRIALASGRKRLVKPRKLPLFAADGAVEHIVTIMEDVTERTEAKEALDASRQQLQDMAEAASDWFWETDPELRLRVFRQGGSVSRAIDCDRFLGETFGLLIKSGTMRADERETGRIRDAVLARKSFRDFVCRLDRGGGEIRLRLNGKPIFDQAGGFTGYRGTASDITTQIAAEATAANARNQLIEAIEGTDDGFGLFDKDDKLVVANSHFKDYWPDLEHRVVVGASYEALLRASTEIRHPHLTPQQKEARIADRMQSHRNPPTRFERQFGDGRWFRVKEWATNYGGTGVIFTDITALKEREQSLRQSEQAALLAKKAAEDANRSKSDFLAKMSHELRTPLNAVIGFSEIMRDELFGPLGGKHYEGYVKDIHSSGSHLLSLINDILDMSKVESGTVELYEEEVELGTVIDESIRLVRDRADANSITVGVAHADDLPPLWADERKLRQILINLLSNAVKFTLEGGSVTVGAELDAEGKMVIRVADTGIGIDPEHLETVLTPFGQVESPLNRKYEGTGLGLPLTKALTELHGGTLEIASVFGQGTTVSISFPARRTVGGRTEATRRVANAGGRR